MSIRSCARCIRESDGAEWGLWPTLIGRHGVDLGWVCPACLTESDTARLVTQRERGCEESVLDFDCEHETGRRP